MAMDYIRAPAQFSYCFDHAPGKENGSLVIVFVLHSCCVSYCMLALEIIIVINEVNLHACRLYAGHLYNKRMVSIIYDEVHPRQTDDFMKLIPSFVDGAISGHKCPDLFPPFLYALRQITADL